MCFSAYASFAAAGALTAFGYCCQSGQSRTEDSYYFIRKIPYLFGLQQALEGGVWATLGSDTAHTFGIGFLFFAMIVWPIWFPLSIWHAETKPRNKHGLLIVLILAAAYAAYNAYLGLTHTILVGALDQSLRYTTQEGFIWRPYLTYFYLAATFSPFIVTSIRWIKIPGALFFIAYLIADWYYTTTFVSVWCFFAALVSLTLYVGLAKKA